MPLKIAVDVDGVLADQVSLILTKLNPKYGLHYTKDDITQWDQKIGETDIKTEIEKALLDSEYVLSLPTIEGAIEGMELLYQTYHVTVATSRPKETEEATKKWVRTHFKYHDFCNTRGKTKDCVQSDVLIDDYIPNIEDFTKNKGIGLLFSQPWNQEHSKLVSSKGKIYFINSWHDAVNIIKEIDSKSNDSFLPL